MPVLSPAPRHCAALLLSLVLAACGGGGGSAGSELPPPAAAQATLEATPAVIELEAGSGVSKTITVTNRSTVTAANAVRAALPGGWSDVVQDAGDCITLAAGASCELVFTPGNDTHAATGIIIAGTDTEGASVTLSVTMPDSAALAAAGSPLTLEAGSGAYGAITLTNTSTLLTASNIAADLTGTPLDGNVTQDASACASLLPQASCELRFTPLNAAITLSHFPIRGDNTGQAGGAIEITLPTSAMLAVANSPLVLQASTGAPYPAGGLLVTNNSSLLTATSVAAELAGTALDGQVTQDASDCVSLAPLATCWLAFTAHSSAVANTAVVIQGANTSQAGAAIAVNAPLQATITVTPALTLTASGGSGTLTVTNTSPREIAQNIGLDTTGTALAGEATLSSTTCGAGLASGASCTLTLAPSANIVGATTLPIAGDNTTVATSIVQIAQPIGASHAGGIVFQQPLGNAPGKLVGDTSTTAIWGSVMTTGATSWDDGMTNTATILAAEPTAPAALFCGSSTEDGYSDWYLPADLELHALMNQTDHRGGPISGIPGGGLWASTEDYPDQASMSNSVNRYSGNKANSYAVRCVRQFDN